jgi:hypothetical protein
MDCEFYGDAALAIDEFMPLEVLMRVVGCLTSMTDVCSIARASSTMCLVVKEHWKQRIADLGLPRKTWDAFFAYSKIMTSYEMKQVLRNTRELRVSWPIKSQDYKRVVVVGMSPLDNEGTERLVVCAARALLGGSISYVRPANIAPDSNARTLAGLRMVMEHSDASHAHEQYAPFLRNLSGCDDTFVLGCITCCGIVARGSTWTANYNSQTNVVYPSADRAFSWSYMAEHGVNTVVYCGGKNAVRIPHEQIMRKFSIKPRHFLGWPPCLDRLLRKTPEIAVAVSVENRMPTITIFPTDPDLICLLKSIKK